MNQDFVLLGVVLGIITVAVIIVIAATRKSQSKSRTMVDIPTRQPTFDPNLQADLVAIEGQHQGKRFSISTVLARSDAFFIGRVPHHNTVVIDNNLVSRTHTQILYEDGHWLLYDCDSANGTWVNDQRVMQHHLQHNDLIQIGSSVFRFESPQRALSTARTKTVNTQYTDPITVASQTKITNSINLNNYHILDQLGSGGIAKVYRAQNHTGQTVAIKFLMRNDPYLHDKFQGELRLGEILRHKNIVQIYGGGINPEGKPYFVMELIEGRTLRQWLSSGVKLKIDQIVSIIGQTCEALAYAHHLKIFHRDIKPENIMITHQGQVKVIDFGIARVDANITKTAEGVIVGTPAYLSYEQAKGHPIDGRSDIYSLGIVLYELLTDELPFHSDEPLRIINMHIKKMPTPPRQINPTVPDFLDRAVMRCLDKNRENRYKMALEFARAIGYTPTIAPDMTGTSRTPQPGQSARITVETTGQVIPIYTASVSLGRQTVNPHDGKMSRQHGNVHSHEGRYWLEDTSVNGTFLNGVRVQQIALLQSGDEIRMGQTRLKFHS